MSDQEDAAARYERACEKLKELYPMIGGGLLSSSSSEDGLADIAHRVLGRYLVKDESGLENGLESFARISFDFLRLQSRFLKTRRYRASDTAKINRELYQNDEKMSGYYLDGLFLTYAFWPNHARIYRYFLERFIPALSPEASVIEVGVGHGLMALALLEEREGARYTGVDISASSLAYARALLDSHAISDARARFYLADICDREASSRVQAPASGWDAAICCEVLEHVTEPGRIVERLHDSVRPGGRVFVTTVANLEAEDHVYLYDDEEHIRRELSAGGFDIEDDLVLRLPGYEDAGVVPLNYAAILTPRVT